MTIVRSQIRYPLAAQWVEDYQGTKHYDGDILFITTRYWPRDGGSRLLLPAVNLVNENQLRLNQITQSSARSSLLFRFGDHEFIELISARFVGETEEEVKQQVEHWAQMQMNRVVTLLSQEFSNLQ